MVSVPVVPKLNPNHVGIGSRTERLRVPQTLDNRLTIKGFCFYEVY